MTTTQTISRERLEEIKEFGSARIITPINDDEILSLVDIALSAMDSEPVTVPDHITYIQSPTLENVLSDVEENSPMAHAARILAREVKFWRSVPLYAAPLVPVAVPDEIVGWVRDENGDSRDPLFLCGSVKPDMGKAYSSQYFPVKRAAAGIKLEVEE